MRPLTETEVRRSFVNCSRGEANTLTLPRDLDVLDRTEQALLGWRDPKAPLRGYLVAEVDGDPVGIAVRAADSRMSGRASVMCLLWRTARPGDGVSSFTARRAGEAGRNGNTVGTYICADLQCAQRVRTEIPPWPQDRNPVEVGAERWLEPAERIRGFLDSVRRP